METEKEWERKEREAHRKERIGTTALNIYLSAWRPMPLWRRLFRRTTPDAAKEREHARLSYARAQYLEDARAEHFSENPHGN